MLPASQTNNPPNARSNLMAMVVAVVFLMIYTMAVGLGLLSGVLRPSTGHLLMILPCLLLVLWYGYGYGKDPTVDGNTGLLLLLVGWALVSVGLLIRFMTAVRIEDVIATGVLQNQIQSDLPASAAVALLLGLIFILAGVYFSWRANKEL